MKTNDIKKGWRIQLANGWYGTMKDNMKGNTRLAEVEGFFKEIGSVYSHDIIRAQNPETKEWFDIDHTADQNKLKSKLDVFFG